jgi:hypothetical protein
METSKPGVLSQGRGGSGGSIPGVQAECLPVERPTPQYPTAPYPAGSHRGPEAHAAYP